MQVSPVSHPALRALRTTVLLCATALLAACSWFADGQHDTEVQDLPPLEVPPDLIKPQGKAPLLVPEVTTKKTADGDCATAAPAPLERISRRVLPPQKDVRIVRDGRHRWLMVDVEPEQMWPLARNFLTKRGYRIVLDEPGIALIETDWRTREISGVDKSSLRERLRLRIEPGQVPGTSEVYMNQAQAERNGDGEWELRTPDDERAAEMLNRLARYLGDEDVGQAMPLKALDASMGHDEDGNIQLRIAAPWEAVWRRAGIALDNLGFVIEDRDRANRVYRVYTEVASGRSEEAIKYGKQESATVRLNYELKVSEADSEVLIQVRDSDGKPDNSEPARHLLTQIQGQFR